MEITAIEKEFFHYFLHLNKNQKETLLEMIKAFSQEKNEFNQSPSLQAYNQEIEEAMKEIDQGDFIHFEQLEKEIEKW